MGIQCNTAYAHSAGTWFEGDFYFNPKRVTNAFPAALFDSEGYILFPDIEAFEKALDAGLIIPSPRSFPREGSFTIHVPSGISSLSGYINTNNKTQPELTPEPEKEYMIMIDFHTTVKTFKLSSKKVTELLHFLVING